MSKPATYQGFIIRPDKLRLFSLSYRGFSSRHEFCLMLGLAVLLGNLVYILSWAMDREALSWLGLHDIEYGRAYLQRANGSRISFSLDCLTWLPLYLLFVLPASIRRARQANLLLPALVALGCVAVFFGLDIVMPMLVRDRLPQEVLLKAWCSIALPLFILHLPLCFIGGPFTGRKTELMRAAIAGNEESARQEIAQNPAVALIKSERGYRASDFAALGGHAALADYLREVEASQARPEENEPCLQKAAPLRN